MGHPTGTVTQRSLAVANRAHLGSFATHLSHGVYPNKTFDACRARSVELIGEWRGILGARWRRHRRAIVSRATVAQEVPQRPPATSFVDDSMDNTFNVVSISTQSEGVGGQS